DRSGRIAALADRRVARGPTQRRRRSRRPGPARCLVTAGPDYDKGETMAGEGVMQGRVIVITGAGRGIGREIALLAAREGGKVVVNDLGGGPEGEGENPETAASVRQEIRAAGGEAGGNTESGIG